MNFRIYLVLAVFAVINSGLAVFTYKALITYPSWLWWPLSRWLIWDHSEHWLLYKMLIKGFHAFWIAAALSATALLSVFIASKIG